MSVIVILTLINEELLLADHIPLTLTVLGITVSVCRSLIPNKVTNERNAHLKSAF